MILKEKKDYSKIIKIIIDELRQLKGTTEVVDSNAGYIDGRLNNNHFFIIDIKNEYEAYLSVSYYGLHRIIMPVDRIRILLRQLSK
jgi:hypothetical protein